MAGDVTVGWCHAGRIGALQAFIDQYWKAGHVFARDAELLAWQYRLPGDPDHLSVLIAENAGQIIGMLGVIPNAFWVRGVTVPGAWLTMWFAAPEWRSHGVALRLLKAVLTGEYGVVGTLGGNQITQKVLGALHFQTTPALPRWICPGSDAAFQRLLAHERQLPRLVQPEPFPRRPRQDPMAPLYVVLPWQAEAAERWDRSWSQSLASHVIGTARDSAYLKWRYIEHPRFTYFVQFVEDRETHEVLGYAVHRSEQVRDQDVKVLRIVDLLVKDERATHALLQSVIQVMEEEEEIAFCDLYGFSPGSEPPLRSAGFVQQAGSLDEVPSHFQPLEALPRAMSAALWLAPALRQQSTCLLQDEALCLSRSDCDQDRPN